MASLSPYLNFNGNAEEAFNFYKSVFGGEFSAVMRFSEVPAEYQDNAAEANLIMHIALPVGKATSLMGSDVPEAMGRVTAGNNVNIAIHANSREEADKLFNGLSAGGHVTMPMADAFWGDYFGMFEDKYGVSWMVSYSTKYGPAQE